MNVECFQFFVGVCVLSIHLLVRILGDAPVHLRHVGVMGAVRLIWIVHLLTWSVVDVRIVLFWFAHFVTHFFGFIILNYMSKK